MTTTRKLSVATFIAGILPGMMYFTFINLPRSENPVFLISSGLLAFIYLVGLFFHTIDIASP